MFGSAHSEKDVSPAEDNLLSLSRKSRPALGALSYFVTYKAAIAAWSSSLGCLVGWLIPWMGLVATVAAACAITALR